MSKNNQPISYLTIWDVYALAAIVGRATKSAYSKSDEEVVKSAALIADRMIDLRKEKVADGP